MKFELVQVSKYLYRVFTHGIHIGDISFDRGLAWHFHYTAQWVNPSREQREEVWKLINDKVAVLNLTSRLLR